MPPQVNATLSRVQGVSAGEAVDGPVAAGAEKWAGSVGAYLRERRNRQREAATGNVEIDRQLIVENDDPPVDWAIGDVVTFTPAGAASQTGTVQLVERRAISDPAIPPELQTTRLTLEPA